MSTSRLSSTFIQVLPTQKLFNKFLIKVKDFVILNKIVLIFKYTQDIKMVDIEVDVHNNMLY